MYFESQVIVFVCLAIFATNVSAQAGTTAAPLNRCYTCTWNNLNNETDSRCLDAPETADNPWVPCPEERECYVMRIHDPINKTIHSISRGCETRFAQDGCADDGTELDTCYDFCDEDLCNGGDWSIISPDKELLKHNLVIEPQPVKHHIDEPKPVKHQLINDQRQEEHEQGPVLYAANTTVDPGTTGPTAPPYRCYACTYSAVGDDSCLTAPWNVTTGVVWIDCQPERFCYVTRTHDPPYAVWSMGRGCEAKYTDAGCTAEANGRTTCVEFCQTDLCNGEDWTVTTPRPPRPTLPASSTVSVNGGHVLYGMGLVAAFLVV